MTTTLSAAMSSSTHISLCNDEPTYVSLCFLSTAVVLTPSVHQRKRQRGKNCNFSEGKCKPLVFF